MNESPSTTPGRRMRLAALTVAGLGVLTLTAGAFVLSYPGARDTAVAAGISMDLARIYPGIFDAVLLVAGAAAFCLRGVLRGYAWLVIGVVVAAVAAADVTHALSVTLPRRQMEVAAAVVPWAALLIGFTLLYAMAWQGWPARKTAAAAGDLLLAGQAGAPARPETSTPAGNGTVKVPLSALLGGKPGAATPGG